MGNLQFKLRYLLKSKLYVSLIVVPVAMVLSTFYYVSMQENDPLIMNYASSIVENKVEQNGGVTEEVSQKIRRVYELERQMLLAEKMQDEAGYVAFAGELGVTLEELMPQLPLYLRPYFFEPEIVYEKHLKSQYKMQGNLPLFQAYNEDLFVDILTKFLLVLPFVLCVSLTCVIVFLEIEHTSVFQSVPIKRYVKIGSDLLLVQVGFVVIPMLFMLLTVGVVSLVTQKIAINAPVIFKIGQQLSAISLPYYLLMATVLLACTSFIAYALLKVLAKWVKDSILCTIICLVFIYVSAYLGTQLLV